MRTDDLDFALPPELIAQAPAPERSAARLLHYRRADRAIAHRTFADLPSLLRPGDLLVFNDSRVIPARFTLRKSTGGLVEGLFLYQEPRSSLWEVLLKNPGRPGQPMHFAEAPDISATLLPPPIANRKSQIANPDEARPRLEARYRLQLPAGVNAFDLLSRIGRMPLPPYIKRDKVHDRRDALDRDRYQTVYAQPPGSVAAPTAGLHFTPELLVALDAAGIRRTCVTLHVGLGTFKPVTVPTLAEHRMHAEWYDISPAAADALNAAARDGRRIIAVGTTSARVLESQPAAPPPIANRKSSLDPELGAEGQIENPCFPIAPASAWTQLLIYPPYPWKRVGALITNFHLPRSTLIALVAAFTGLDEQRRIYAAAIAEKYRFFSYGDAMFIE